MSVARIPGQRSRTVSTLAPAAAPAVVSTFARQLKARRGALAPPAQHLPSPTSRQVPKGTIPTSAMARDARTTSPPARAPARTVNQTRLVHTQLPERAPGAGPIVTPVALSRAVAQLLMQLRSVARRPRHLGLISETTVSIEGLGDVIVSVYRTDAGWIVQVDADALTRCMTGVERFGAGSVPSE